MQSLLPEFFSGMRDGHGDDYHQKALVHLALEAHANYLESADRQYALHCGTYLHDAGLWGLDYGLGVGIGYLERRNRHTRAILFLLIDVIRRGMQGGSSWAMHIGETAQRIFSAMPERQPEDGRHPLVLVKPTRLFELAGLNVDGTGEEQAVASWIVTLDQLRSCTEKPERWGWLKPSSDKPLQLGLGTLSIADAYLVWWTRQELLGLKRRTLEPPQHFPITDRILAAMSELDVRKSPVGPYLELVGQPRQELPRNPESITRIRRNFPDVQRSAI